MKTITIAAYNRPSMLRSTLLSLQRQVDYLNDYRLLIRIDYGGDRFEEVFTIAEQVDFMEHKVHFPAKHEGVNLNTYNAMDYVFSEWDSSYNLYLEDDLVLSPDALCYLDWCEQQGKWLPNVGAYCLCNLVKDKQDPTLVRYGARRFNGWGFMMPQGSWLNVARNVWLAGNTMWDNRLADGLRRAHLFNVFPYVSRATNIGRFGEHFTPKKYDKIMKGQKHQRRKRRFKYVFV